MSLGHIFPGQLASVKDGPRNLPLKFGHDQVSNSWDIADIEFAVGGCACAAHKAIFGSNLAYVR